MRNLRIERIFGIILLIPPTIGSVLFMINLFINSPGNIAEMKNLSSEWTGTYGHGNSGGGGYTSAAPIYLGLMAISGAFLLKGTDKRKTKGEKF
jgi:hypothetical protein